MEIDALLPPAVEELMKAAREAASSRAWSRGVELSRAQAVVGRRADGEEIQLDVSTRGGLETFQVLLYPEDEDWSCTCSSREDVCEHVVASVLGLRSARAKGQELPTAGDGAGVLRYAFSRAGKSIAFTREVVTPGGEARELTASLAAIATDRVRGPKFIASQLDLQIEVALGASTRGKLSRTAIGKLAPFLRDASEITFEGKKAQFAKPHPGLRAVVEDAGEGFRVRLETDPAIDEIFDNGVLRIGASLHPLAENTLDGRELDSYRAGELVSPDRLSELVSEIIPRLEARIPVHVSSKRLPTAERMLPRLDVEVHREDDKLSVLPLIVYGDPPVARVDGDSLTLLEGSTPPVRDRKAEQRLAQSIRDRLGSLPGERIRYDSEAAIALRPKLEALGNALRGDDHQAFYRTGQLQADVDFTRSTLGIEFHVPLSNGTRGTASLESVVRAWQDDAPLVPLLGGGFAGLPTDWLERYGRTIADLLAARDERGEVRNAAMPELHDLAEDLGVAPPPRARDLIAALEAQNQDSDLPADLRAELRDYQREGVRWLRGLESAGLGALLADDMGLGKTLQTLCVVGSNTLVVAPTSVIFNWRKEIEKFRPQLTVNLFHGPQRKLDDSDITLTSYGVLRLDKELLAARRWNAAVLDEAQAIKNPASKVAKAAATLDAAFRVTLTGTPVENRLEELWSQMNFINPGLLGRQEEFSTRYSKPIEDGDTLAAAHLRKRLAPFIKRRLKRDVAPELPPRTDLTVYCEMDDEQRQVYEAIRATTLEEVRRLMETQGGVMEALEALLRLRQAACHVALLPGRSAPTSAKLDVLDQALEETLAEGHKALVFSQWTSFLDLAQNRLDDSGVSYLRLDGSTRDRQAVVDSFQDDSGPGVLLISLKAGGTGLNLTAADHVFLLDPWWNPAAEDQAADRAHRIGQDRPVFVHRLIARGTVEERILELQQKKRALADAALSDATAGQSITREEIFALFD